MNEIEMLKKAKKLEENKEYDNAISILDCVLQNNYHSYHALFMKFCINKKKGLIDRGMLHKAFHEAKNQDASDDVLDLMLDEISCLPDTETNKKIMEKINKIERLIEGAKSEGEKEAALNAKRKLEEKKYEEISEDLIEYRISTNDMWHKTLFMALCRKHGFNPYRYYRQKHTTVMVKISRHYLDNFLWKEYLKYSEQLDSLINDITDEIISKIHKFEEETVIMGEIEHDG